MSSTIYHRETSIWREGSLDESERYFLTVRGRLVLKLFFQKRKRK